MSEEDRNVAILKDVYAAWHETKGKSVDRWLAICADQLNFGSLAQTEKTVPYMKLYESKDTLGEYFRGLARDWEMIEYAVEHYVAQGDRVVTLGRCTWKAKKSGVVVWTPIANSFRFQNGKIVEFYEYFDTAQVRDAMMA
jgi:ketosteroid isomerase-like protein